MHSTLSLAKKAFSFSFAVCCKSDKNTPTYNIGLVIDWHKIFCDIKWHEDVFKISV